MASHTPRTHLGHVARSLARGTDSALMRLSRMLSSPAGMDKTLCTLQYTLMVVHTQLARLQGLRYRLLLRSISRKLSSVLLPGETLVATLSPPESRVAGVLAGSKALSGLISDFRTFTRMWGLLDMYAWGRATWLSPPADGVTRSIVWSQIAANTLFQWYENVAYLASKKVLRGERFSQAQQNKWWEWSSRFWLAHIALEAVRLARVWQLDQRRASASASAKDAAGDPPSNLNAAWRKELTVNTAWAPVAWHYSWIEGCLKDDWVALYGLIAGSTGFRYLWKQTTSP